MTPKMQVTRCPIEGCDYSTPDVEAVVAAALITTHATSHQNGPVQASRVEKVRSRQLGQQKSGTISVPAGTTMRGQQDWKGLTR